MQKTDLMVCGIGGQGNILVERILGAAAIKLGLDVMAADTFGAAQRGGSVLTHLRLAARVFSPLVSQGQANVVLGLEPGEGLRVAREYLNNDGLLIVNTATVLPPKARSGNGSYPRYEEFEADFERLGIRVASLNATDLAIKHAGNVKAMNIVMLGALMAHEILPIDADTVKAAIHEFSPQFAQMNINAFEAGYLVPYTEK